MKYEVIQNYRTNYPNPITFEKGDCLTVGEKYSGPESWDNWIFCTTLDKRIGGWVPQQLIQIDKDKGIALEDYTAKELNVNENEKFIGLKELNGWIWCRGVMNGEEGWIPKDHLKPLN